MVDIPDVLNYGGFGALILILIVVGRFVQVRLNDSVKREQTMTDKAMERADKAEGAWREMVASNIEVNARLATVMDQMCKEIANGTKKNNEAHQSLLIQLARMENQRKRSEG